MLDCHSGPDSKTDICRLFQKKKKKHRRSELHISLGCDINLFSNEPDI